MPEKIVVVFDSSVLIPLVIPASRSTRLFRRLRSSDHDVVASPLILEEVADKMQNKAGLRDWLALTDKEIKQFLDDLPKQVEMVPGHRQAHGAVPADPKDDMVIATALEAKAEYIISEDKHLLELGEHQGIKIMSREKFEAELDRLGLAE